MKNKLVLILGGLVLVLLSALITVIATGMFSNNGGPAADAAPPEPENPYKEAKYLQLDPEFVVNFGANARPKYLMIEVSASTPNQEALDALQQHMPVVRNQLLALFGDQEAAKLKASEAKEALRVATLETIQGIMEERFGEKGIDEVFFTRFVMQ